MFTGIVEEVGRIDHVDRSPGLLSIRIAASKVVTGVIVGDSISVSGVCLTVVEINDGGFSVELVPETLRRSWLREVEEGGLVNLERSATLERFFGGHYVQGHVDGEARIVLVEPDGDAQFVRFEPLDANLLRYIVEKGYVTLDGASLTAFELSQTGFSVSFIPHTQKSICLGGRRLGPSSMGGTVHLEVDVMAKYVERLLQQHPLHRGSGNPG